MRTVANIIIITSILFFPWWITTTILIISCFAIPRFYEAIFFGILIDAFYGTKLGIYGLAYIFSVFSVIIFFLSAIIRNRVVW
ncbi:MAG: hypothetical protein AAB484_03010 [Patescibacteria group bacterium]